MNYSVFLFFVGVIFLANFVDKAFPCRAMVSPNGCCWYTFFFGFLKCAQSHSPKCNFFEHNCVGCVYVYPTANKCDVLETRCSCFYCCDPQYAETCPDGCKNCIKDGEGGCPENNSTEHARLKSIDGDKPLHLKALGKACTKFNAIDTDKSGAISVKEAISYLEVANNGSLADYHATGNMTWFTGMDSNGNNQIEPGEFDRSLN